MRRRVPIVVAFLAVVLIAWSWWFHMRRGTSTAPSAETNKVATAAEEAMIPQPADKALARRLYRQFRRRGHVMLIGLDGADWHMIDPLIAAGRMPHLKKILAHGAHGPLKSFEPMLSPLVWTTIATGVPPEVHGVLDFFERGPDGKMQVVGSNERRVPALWNIISALKHRVGVIGWWASHPAEHVHGVIVSDRVTLTVFPGQGEQTPDFAHAVFPPSWGNEVEKLRVDPHTLDPALIQSLAKVSDGDIQHALAPSTPLADPLRMLYDTVAATETTARLGEAAWKTFHPDLLLVYFEGTDAIGHLFAPDVKPPVKGALPGMVARFSDTPANYYSWVDGKIGALAGLLGPNDTLVICSDHGFHWGPNRPQTTESGTRTHAATLWHRMYGIVALEGAGIKAGARGRGSVFDIAPTLLALLDLPPGKRMTGKVLDWAFLSPPETGKPVDYQKLVGNWRAGQSEARGGASGGELKKLEALGYVGGGSSPVSSSGENNGGPTPGALNNLGSRLMSRGDLQGARAAFERSIRADPGYPGSYRNLATALVKLGDYPGAVKAFFQAFDRGMIKPEDASVNFAIALKEKGQTATALQVLADARRRRPASYTLALNDGTMLGQTGHLEEALAAFRKACEINPTSAIAWRNRGVAALQLGHKQEAEVAFSKSLELNPDQPDLQRMVVRPRH